MDRDKNDSIKVRRWEPGGPSAQGTRRLLPRRIRRIDFCRFSREHAANDLEEQIGQKKDPQQSPEPDPLEEAYMRGREDGMAQGTAKMEPFIQQIRSLLRSLTAAKEEFLGECEAGIVDLAIMIAEKVLHREVEMNREGVVELTKVAMKKILERERLEIRVHPSDHELLTRERDALIQEVDGIKQLIVTADPGIGPGGCVISTVLGEVDAQLDHQVKEIARVLKAD